MEQVGKVLLYARSYFKVRLLFSRVILNSKTTVITVN
jgi:hypothetical protein